MCVLFLGDLSEEGKRLFFLVRIAAVDSRERDRRVCPRPSTTAGRGRGEKQNGFSPLLPPLPSCPQRPAINCQAKGNRGERGGRPMRPFESDIKAEKEGRTEGSLFGLFKWIGGLLSFLFTAMAKEQCFVQTTWSGKISTIPTLPMKSSSSLSLSQTWSSSIGDLSGSSSSSSSSSSSFFLAIFPSATGVSTQRSQLGERVFLATEDLRLQLGTEVPAWWWAGSGRENFFEHLPMDCRLHSYFRMWPPHMGPRRRPGPGG